MLPVFCFHACHFVTGEMCITSFQNKAIFRASDECRIEPMSSSFQPLLFIFIGQTFLRVKIKYAKGRDKGKKGEERKKGKDTKCGWLRMDFWVENIIQILIY